MNEVKTEPANHREHIAGKVVNLGLFANILLALVKVTVGIIGGSRALLADGINSTSDVAYYIVVKIFTRLAGKPADEEHPYGHYQMESIAAVIIGAFVMTTAIAIFWESVNTTFGICKGGGEENIRFELFSMITALGTVIVKLGLFIHTRNAATSTKNAALSALAFDHRNDIFSSLGAVVGIALDWCGISWGDPVAGACVAIIILRTGIDILRESSSDLMDTLPDHSLEKQVRSLAGNIKGVKAIEYLRAHRFGPYYVVNITIGVEGGLSVAEGDQIATEVEDVLIDKIELLKKIYVHFHPVSR